MLSARSDPMQLTMAGPFTGPLSTPTVAFLALAVVAELLLWLGGVESQFTEIWLVVLAVPLVLSLSKSQSGKVSKAAPVGKCVDEEPQKRRSAPAPKRTPK